jgi:hypothetical protein
VQIHDNADQMFSALVSYSREGSSPTVWARDWATGVDWLAQGYTNNLYTIPFIFLPAWVAYSLVMFIQRLIAGYFMFRVLENRAVERIACWYGGLAYSLYLQVFSPGFTLFKGLADAAFPLLLWTLTRKAKTATSLYLVAFAIGILYALSASFHLALFAFVLLPIWLVIFNARTELRSWIALGTLFLGWVLAEAPSIAAAALNAGQSQRADWNAVAVGDLPVAMQLLTASLKYNLPSLVVVLLAIAVAQYRRKYIRWLVVVLACAAAPLLWYVIDARFHSQLRFLSGFSWGRIFLLVPFLAIAGAALASEALSKARVGRLELRFVMPVVVAVVLGQSFLLNASLIHVLAEGSNYAELYRNPDLLELAQTARSTTPPYRVASVGIHPGFMWGYGLETADGYLNIYPMRYQQFWERVIDKSLNQDASLRSYFQNRGSRIYLYVPGQEESGMLALLKSPGTALRFADFFDLDLLSLANVKYIVSTVPLDDSRLVQRPSAIRQKQLAWQRKKKIARYVDVLLGRSPGIPLYIYENREVLPRFFCARKVMSETPQEVLRTLPRLSAKDLLTQMLVADAISPSRVMDEEENINPKNYSADCVVLQVTSEAGCPLMVTNNYSPYWSASVDGKHARLLAADHTFQGIIVPPGTHDVELQYSPPYAPGGCR